jgi:glycerol-3-phosphate acyltransferase PlsY
VLAEIECTHRLRAVLAIAVGFGAGAVPFSNLMARWRAGVDLRSVGNGTVSGTALYEVAGAGPLVVAGIFELAKGAVGPVLAGRSHPVAAALAGAAAVCGHNWSPFLGGAGGRGISPAIGALAVTAPAGSVVLLSGLVGGRMAGETAVGSLVADAAVVPVSGWAHGRVGRWAAAAVLVPVLVKRLLGNAPPSEPGAPVYAWRLLFDRDTRTKAGAAHHHEEAAS